VRPSPKEKSYNVWDDRGLDMLVTPTGGRLWRFRYRIGAVEKLLALGAYPMYPSRGRAKVGMRREPWRPTTSI